MDNGGLQALCKGLNKENPNCIHSSQVSAIKKKKRQRNEQPPVTYKDIHQHHNIRVLGRYKSLILSQTSTLKLQPSTATEIVFNFSCFAFVCTYIRTYTYVYICMQQPVSVTQPMKFYRQLLLINLEDTFSFSRTNP